MTPKFMDDMQDHIDHFNFNQAPFSSFRWPLFGGIIYIIIIFVIQFLMKPFPPFRLKFFSVIHNLFLCLLSLLMLIGVLVAIIKVAALRGIECVYCDVPDHPLGTMEIGSMAFWCWVFYASKYYEMLDTIILVLKKRPLTLVHVYHHFIVPYLFWSFLSTTTTAHWILVVANCSVHVVMYYYYMMFTLGYDMWWKKYLTQMQIVQFFMDIMGTWPALISIFVFDSWRCSGRLWPVIFGHLVGLSFIYLFTAFYIRTYRAQKKLAREAAAAKAREGGTVTKGDETDDRKKKKID